MKTILQLLSAITLTLCFSYAQAADIAGRVIMVRGDATATSATGETRELGRRDQVYASDTITTGDNSRIQIRFIDKGLMALRANSRLSIKTYRQPDAGENEGEVLMELVEGGFRTLTGTIGKGNKAAYKVNTPVASIGIRGTLYSVLLQKGQLLAGVWKGGIQLNGAQGSINLGADSDFNFAQFGSQGVRGLLQAPADLQQPSSQPEASDSEQKDDQAPAAQLSTTGAPATQEAPQNEQPVSNTTELPNSLDREKDSGSEKNLTSKSQIGSGNSGSGNSGNDNNGGNGNSGNGSNNDQPLNSTSDDVRLSDSEYKRFLNTQEFGAYVAAGKVTAGSTFQSDDDKEVFVSIKRDSENLGVNVTRFSGTSTQKETPMANVSWGIWEGSQETPIYEYTNDKKLDKNDIAQKALWIKTTPIRTQDLNALMGNVRFGGSSTTAPGFNNEGTALTSVSGNFDLDLSNGSVSNGQLNASYGNDQWAANFTGTIRANGATQNSALVDVNITGGTHGSVRADGTAASLNLNNSAIGGVLTQPQSNGGLPGFAGGFHLEDNDKNSATGLIAWPGSRPQEQ